MIRFRNLRAGMIGRVMVLDPIGRIDTRWWKGSSEFIQHALNKAKERAGYGPQPEVGCHDFLVINYGGNWYAGDQRIPRARLTQMSYWEGRMSRGEVAIQFLWPVCATERQGLLAANWWREKCEAGWRYSWQSYGWLWITLVNEEFDLPFDLEASYCTEGIEDAFTEGAGLSIYSKAHPTPYTTWKRHAIQGLFRDDSREVIVNRLEPQELVSTPLGLRRVVA